MSAQGNVAVQQITPCHSYLQTKRRPVHKRCKVRILRLCSQGLEKYLMTKLFPRAFAPLPEDVARDERLSAKLAALQQFVRPEHLDIPSHHYNEASWLVSARSQAASRTVLRHSCDNAALIASLRQLSRLRPGVGGCVSDWQQPLFSRSVVACDCSSLRRSFRRWGPSRRPATSWCVSSTAAA